MYYIVVLAVQLVVHASKCRASEKRRSLPQPHCSGYTYPDRRFLAGRQVSAAAADGLLLLLLPQQQVKDFAVAMLSYLGSNQPAKGT